MNPLENESIRNALKRKLATVKLTGRDEWNKLLLGDAERKFVHNLHFALEYPPRHQHPGIYQQLHKAGRVLDLAGRKISSDDLASLMADHGCSTTLESTCLVAAALPTVKQSDFIDAMQAGCMIAKTSWTETIHALDWSRVEAMEDGSLKLDPKDHLIVENFTT